MIKILICMVLGLYSNYTDLKCYKIYNFATVTFFVFGIFINILTDEIFSSLSGAAIMLILLPLFAFKKLGAGDIKELMAMGSILALPKALYLLQYSFICGAVMAVIVILVRRFGIIVFNQKLHCIQNSEYQSRNRSFRFSFAITAGLFVILLQSIFEKI